MAPLLATVMQDTVRRANLRARIEVQQQTIAQLQARMHPSAKHILQHTASLFDLAAQLLDGRQDFNPEQEAWWLNQIQKMILLAETSLQSARELMDRYGGPENVRVIAGPKHD